MIIEILKKTPDNNIKKVLEGASDNEGKENSIDISFSNEDIIGEKTYDNDIKEKKLVENNSDNEEIENSINISFINEDSIS